MKMGFSERAVGHMTLRKWARMYKAYKQFEDNHRLMVNKNLLYADLEKEPTIDDLIPF